MAELLESRMANLFRDYLIAADVSTGIPSVDTLPRRGMDENKEEITHPILIISAESPQDMRRSLAKIVVNIKLSADISTEGEEARDVSAWVSSIRSYIDDDASWRTFITSLPESAREGFQIIWQRIGAPIVVRDSEAKVMSVLLTVSLSIAVQR